MFPLYASGEHGPSVRCRVAWVADMSSVCGALAMSAAGLANPRSRVAAIVLVGMIGLLGRRLHAIRRSEDLLNAYPAWRPWCSADSHNAVGLIVATLTPGVLTQLAALLVLGILGT